MALNPLVGPMKALKIAIIMILVFNAGWSLMKWLSPEPQPQPLASNTPAQLAPADSGLDLAALVGLTKEIRSGQELERRLNEQGSINNLDLDANGKVDYLQVQEFGEPAQGAVGYSLYTEPAKDQRQEVAEVTVQQNGDKAEIQVVGNEQIYGPEAIYNDWAPVERQVEQQQQTRSSGYPMYSSYFMPHPLWLSPFGFGFYPPYFSFFPVMGPSMYMNRVSHYRSGVDRGANRYSQQSGKNLNNPNKGKAASSGIKRSLKKPTTTQKQFQAKTNRSVGKGGFGQSGARKPATGTNRPALGQRSGSGLNRSGSSFGRSQGLSSPLRSPSYRSRSFGFGGK